MDKDIIIEDDNCDDEVVEDAVKFLRSRSIVGQKKYGTSLQDNDKDDFLLHLQEELADALNYVIKIRKQEVIQKETWEKISRELLIEEDTKVVERFMTKPTYFKCKCGHKQKL
jgi:Mn-containing catalase